MTNRNHEEALLLQKAAKFLPEGSLGNVALDDDHSFIVERGSGSRIWDVSGNEYIDYLMGSGPMVLGHAHPRVVEAVSPGRSGRQHLFRHQPARGAAGGRAGAGGALRRPGAVYHQRHGRLLSGPAHRKGISSSRQNSEV